MDEPCRIPLRARDGTVRAWALVDPEDYERFGHLRWCLTGRDGYAYRMVGREAIKLHRAILGLKRGDPREGDHENRNRLDNRRSNLRIVGHREQQQNMPVRKGRRYRGVRFDKRKGLWLASYGRRFIGYYRTEDDAGHAAQAWRAQHVPFATDEMPEFRPLTRPNRRTRFPWSVVFAAHLMTATTTLTQTQIGDALGISRPTVADFTSGRSRKFPTSL